MIAQAKAGGHHGGGGGTFAAPGAPLHISAPSSHAASAQSFGGGRMIYSGQRFSSVGMRSPYSSAVFRQHYFNLNSRSGIGTHQITRRSINRDDRVFPSSNSNGSHPITNLRRRGNVADQVNNLPASWRNHVVAQHSADRHRDWNRNREHWWRGHRCRFINGSWFIFDFGFDPWWPYWYSNPYYACGPYSYPYSYDDYSGVYQGGEYYDQGGDADQYSNSTVAAAQERLAQQGYYRGEIDGMAGPETHRAILRYQGDHGLRVTGYLTANTLQALGLPRVALN